jgi:hypothetical protein
MPTDCNLKGKAGRCSAHEETITCGGGEEWEFWKWDIGHSAGGSGVYEFYNVLCIECLGEIAYRQGIGRVAKSAWERQDLEEIDVKLG